MQITSTPRMARLRSWVRGSILLNNSIQHLRTIRTRKKHPLGIIPKVPKRVVCEPTNACNLACSFCGNKDMVRPWTYLPMPLYRDLIEQMTSLGIPRLTLHTVGEPTMHDQLVEMVQIAKQAGIVVTLSTNGTLLTPELSKRLVEAGPDILNFSIDAADDELFRSIRKGINPQAVYKNLKDLYAIRNEVAPVTETVWGPAQLPTIVCTCVVTPAFDRKEESAYFKKFGPYVDDFYFHFPNNHAGYVDDEKTRRRFPLPRKLMTWLYRKSRYSCPYPWDALFLLSDGTMSVCRFDFDARVKIGRFNESSLLELWNSDSMNSLRRAHMNFDFSDWSTCQNCDATWTANRHEYYRKTQKLKRRNGYKEDRNAWLTADPVQSKKEDGSGSFGGRKGY